MTFSEPSPPAGDGYRPNAEWHADIQKSASEGGELSQASWLLYTDGSGHKNGYGGYSAFAWEKSTGRMFEEAGALFHTTVEATEFLGLLNGLRAITDRCYVERHHRHGAESYLRVSRPIVHWITDREALALNVWRNPKNGEPVFKRRTPPELWAMFSYFEPLYRIVPLFYGRTGMPMHNLADEMASSCYTLIKEHHTAMLELRTLNIPNAQRKKKSALTEGAATVEVPSLPPPETTQNPVS